MTENCADPVAVDPGARPELAWIPLDVLDVDDRYQREIDTRAGRRVIARMVAEFAWRRFSPLIVTPSDVEGRYMVLDGQHKAAAARQIAGIDSVPAMIVQTEGLSDQAESFVSLNNDRVRVHQYALHRARVAAGDPDAVAIDRVCAAAGVTVPAYPVPANKIAAGETMALRVIGQMIRTHGEEIAQRGLTLLAEAYRDRPGNIRASLIKAVCATLAASISPAELRDRVAAKTAVAWEHEAQRVAAVAGMTVVAALTAAFKGKAIELPPENVPAVTDGGRRAVQKLPFSVNRICSCGAAFKTDVVGLETCMRCSA
tara:strand:+ start:1128 stop:2069 length:942 start_codon:yes stop_codon:yes gene_type:complete